MASDTERRDDDEEESTNELLRDRFRLCTISIANAEAKKYGLEVSQPIMSCISELAFKYAQEMAKDLELFSQHANRKMVNMEDVVLCAHRNENLAGNLRSFRDELKAKGPSSDRKRKKSSKKDDSVVAGDVIHIDDA